MIINGTNISMIRGDSESIVVNVTQDGTARDFIEGDIVYFTVKKRTSDQEKTFQKVVTTFSNGTAIIPITHDDTKNVQTGSYFYDVQATYKDGMVKTLVGPAQFVLLEEVTYE